MIARQTLFEFIDNPMGRGSNAIQSRQAIRQDLTKRLNDLMKTKDIKVSIYKPKKDGQYFFHFLIPSETDRRTNTYDVVLKFSQPEVGPDIANDKDLSRYEVEFFSNSPSFTYTYAYAFNLSNQLVQELAGKFGRTVMNRAPVTRNPFEVINYEKTIFFAAQYLMQNKELLQKRTLAVKAKPLNIKSFSQSIRNIEKIGVEVKTETRRLQEEDKKSAKSKQVHSNQTTKKPTSRVGVRNSGVGRIKPSSKVTPKKKSGITKIKPR